jgi:hypothetical protein
MEASTMTKNVTHIHDKVHGKKALELFAEVRFLNSACCEARYNYLKAQALSYVEWVGKQEWCTDKLEYARNVVAQIEKLLEKDPQGNISDVQVDTVLEADKVCRGEMEGELEDEYRLLSEKIVSKSQRQQEAQLHWWIQRIEIMRDQLKLHETIQDYIDTLKPCKKPGVYRKVFEHMDKRFKLGQLTFDGWVIFNNQVAELIGRKDLVIKPKKLYLLPDRLSYYEKRYEQEKAAFQAKASEFKETDLDVLDNDLIPVEDMLADHVR